MNFDLLQFFDENSSILGYHNAIYTLEIPLPYPNYDNFKTVDVLQWITLDLNHWESTPYVILARNQDRIDILRHTTHIELDKILSQLMFYGNLQYVIVEDLKI